MEEDGLVEDKGELPVVDDLEVAALAAHAAPEWFAQVISQVSSGEASSEVSCKLAPVSWRCLAGRR